MGYKGTGSSFMEYWNATTQGKPDVFIEEWLKPYMTEVFIEKSKFGGEVNKSGTVATLAPSWQTQQDYPDRLTATMATGDGSTGTIVFSGNFNGSTISPELLAQVLRKGSIIQKVESGVIVQAKITQAAPIASLTATIAKHGGTTLTADSNGAIEYQIMAPSWADTRGIEQPTSLPRKREHTFSQIFRGEVEITDTDMNLDEKLITNPLDRQVKMVVARMAREKAAAMVTGRPVWDTGTSTWLTGYDTAEPYMAGVLWWAEYAQANQTNPDIYIDLDNTPLTPKNVKDLGHSVYMTEMADLSRGYQLWGNPTDMRYTETWQEAFRRTDGKTSIVGFENDAIQVEGEIVPFKSDRLIPRGFYFLLPMKDISYGPFKNGTKRKKVETDDFSEQWMIKEHITGLLPENPRHIGVFYNGRLYGT